MVFIREAQAYKKFRHSKNEFGKKAGQLENSFLVSFNRPVFFPIHFQHAQEPKQELAPKILGHKQNVDSLVTNKSIG